MNFLIDDHLPVTLSKLLNSLDGCAATHVNQILQKWNTTDAEICKYADDNNMVVITKDQDFRDSHLSTEHQKRL